MVKGGLRWRVAVCEGLQGFLVAQPAPGLVSGPPFPMLLPWPFHRSSMGALHHCIMENSEQAFPGFHGVV